MTDEERAAARARVQYLLPGLTDAGLRYVLEHAECAARIWPRDLTSGTLAAEQAARHGLLADADDVICKARRERTHGLNCDCGACNVDRALRPAPEGVADYPEVSKASAALARLDAAHLHDSATDAAAVLGTTIGITANGEHAPPARWTDAARSPMLRAPAFVSTETEANRKAAHRGEPPPFVMSEEAARLVSVGADPIIEGIRASQRGRE